MNGYLSKGIVWHTSNTFCKNVCYTLIRNLETDNFENVLFYFLILWFNCTILYEKSLKLHSTEYLLEESWYNIYIRTWDKQRFFIAHVPHSYAMDFIVIGLEFFGISYIFLPTENSNFQRTDKCPVLKDFSEFSFLCFSYLRFSLR